MATPSAEPRAGGRAAAHRPGSPGRAPRKSRVRLARRSGPAGPTLLGVPRRRRPLRSGRRAREGEPPPGVTSAWYHWTRDAGAKRRAVQDAVIAWMRGDPDDLDTALSALCRHQGALATPFEPAFRAHPHPSR